MEERLAVESKRKEKVAEAVRIKNIPPPPVEETAPAAESAPNESSSEA